MASLSIEQLAARNTELRQRLTDLDGEYAGSPLPEDKRREWNEINKELEENTELIGELKAREQRLSELTKDEQHVERPEIDRTSLGGRRSRGVPDDIWAVEEYRNLSGTHEQYLDALGDGAKRAVELATFPHPESNREAEQENLVRLLDTIDRRDRELAQRVLVTASPTYQRAFGKSLIGSQLSVEEQRALGIGSQGGNLPVPITLDPTVILTSSGVVNPMRQLARVERITGNKWQGIASTGITAAYAAEAAEATDDSPTLTQPEIDVAKAHAFVPYSIEVGQDWPSLESEMARLLQDAKDTLESNKFHSGTGTNEPQGLLVGGTTVVNSAATATFAVGDVYSLEEALPSRWRARASIVANRSKLNEVRQFDTSGGSALWVQLGDGIPPRLLAYPTYEYSEMTTSGATGASIVTIGDFSQYLIVDRVGMSIEILPHLLGSNRRPTGQRGLYAYWRNSAEVVTVDAFRTLKLL